MTENLRIEALRRRVQLDPASTAFAALAEAFRRAGHLEEAIDTCRRGLRRHPSYPDARVTLGWALIEAGRLDEATAEVERILQATPESLTVVRALAEIELRRDDPDRIEGIPGRPGCADPEALRALETFLQAIRSARELATSALD